MNFLTYPVNSKNPGSLIPILLGKQLAYSANDANFVVYIDALSRSRNIDFDLSSWLSDRIAGGANLLHPTQKITFSTAKDFCSNIKFEIVDDHWYRCPCGKVEIFNQELVTGPYREKIKMLDMQNKCILCNGELVLQKSRGLVAVASRIDGAKLVYGNEDKIFPKNISQEVIHWIDFFLTKSILVSRTRETPYLIEHLGEVFYFDPTLYDIVGAWTMCMSSSADPYIITGRDGVIPYALGIIFLGSAPGHIFLPRYQISDWNALLKLGVDDLTLLLVGALNWNVNKAIVNTGDLKYIRKNRKLLIEYLKNLPITTLEDIWEYNRNIYAAIK